MPTYQYACTDCSHRFEQVQSFSDDALTECPQCQGRLRKLFNAVGVVFKGSGFYRNDSREPATAGAGKDGKDGAKDGAKDGGGDATKAGAKDGGKDGGKDAGTGGSGSGAAASTGNGAGKSGATKDGAAKAGSSTGSSAKAG